VIPPYEQRTGRKARGEKPAVGWRPSLNLRTSARPAKRPFGHATGFEEASEGALVGHRHDVPSEQLDGLQLFDHFRSNFADDGILVARTAAASDGTYNFAALN
jgi:hypothetical protein